jgi:hypothetical protein
MRVSAGRRAHSPESGPGFRVPRLRIRCRTLAIRLPASDNARIMSTAAAACAFRVTEPSPPQATDAPFATELCAGRPWRRRWQTVLWRRCPYSDSGAEIAFYVVLGIFAVLEQRVRLRSWLNRHGSRVDRGSLLVVVFSVLAGVGGGFALAGAVPAATLSSARAHRANPRSARGESAAAVRHRQPLTTEPIAGSAGEARATDIPGPEPCVRRSTNGHARQGAHPLCQCRVGQLPVLDY